MLNNKEQIGKLDKRVTFQEIIIGQNASNEDEEIGWEDLFTTWAQVEEKSGDEMYRADKLTDFKDSVFTIRYRTGITPKNRIVYNGFKWNILSILNGGRKGFLKITAESGGEYEG